MVTLYHGTSTVFMQEIMQSGLLPRARTGNSVYDGDLTSKGDRVYLTDTYPVHFGELAFKKYGGDLLIVKAKIQESRLEPDTDFTEGGLHQMKYAKWQDCLAKTGCVSVCGTVNAVEMCTLNAEAVATLFEQRGCKRIYTGEHHQAHIVPYQCLLEMALLNGSKFLRRKGSWRCVRD